MAEPEQDDIRALSMLMNKARMLRLSEDTRIAATGAKWERAIREALEAALKSSKIVTALLFVCFLFP